MIFRLPPLPPLSTFPFFGKPVNSPRLQNTERSLRLSAKKWVALAGAGLATAIPATLFAQSAVVAGEILKVPEDQSLIYALEWADRLVPWVLGGAVIAGAALLYWQRAAMQRLLNETVSITTGTLDQLISIQAIVKASTQAQLMGIQATIKASTHAQLMAIHGFLTTLPAKLKPDTHTTKPKGAPKHLSAKDKAQKTVGIALKIPGYQILKELGGGAQGTVFLATKEDLWNSRFAIKVLKSALVQDKDSMKRFNREASLQRDSQHPNLIQIYQFGEIGGHPYMVLEYADGGDLNGWIDRQILENNGTGAVEFNATRILLSLLDGLDHLYRAGSLHRDIKPANVFLDRLGVPKLGDFGLARPMQSQSFQANFMGTVAYAAPEAFEGDAGTPDVRSDLYALGTTLFQMVTKRLPFELAFHDELFQLALRKMGNPPPDPRKFNPYISEELARIILKSIENNRGHRFQTPDEFRQALLHFFHHQVSEVPQDVRHILVKNNMEPTNGR